MRRLHPRRVDHYAMGRSSDADLDLYGIHPLGAYLSDINNGECTRGKNLPWCVHTATSVTIASVILIA